MRNQPRSEKELAAKTPAAPPASEPPTIAHVTAEPGRRVALVIGNDQYKNLPKLQKAVADARSYADVLKSKGFDQVILKSDLTGSQLDEAIVAFLNQIEPGDMPSFAIPVMAGAMTRRTTSSAPRRRRRAVRISLRASRSR